MKFLFDLFPIILFFVAFKFWGIYVATASAIGATVLQIAWVAFRHRRVDPMLWLSFGIVVIFGGATLMLHDETFIKWKPTVLYWVFAVGLLGAHFLFAKNPMKAVMGKHLKLPDPVWGAVNIAWAIFFAVLGVINIVVAYHMTTDAWVNFKLFGSTALMLVFIVAQSFWLGKYGEHE